MTGCQPVTEPLIGQLTSILASHWSVWSVMMSRSRSRTRQMAREIMWVRSSGWHKMSQIGRWEVITYLDPIGQLLVMLSPIGWAVFTRSGLMFDSLWSPDYSPAPALNLNPMLCCLLELIKILVTIQPTVTYQVFLSNSHQTAAKHCNNKININMSLTRADHNDHLTSVQWALSRA